MDNCKKKCDEEIQIFEPIKRLNNDQKGKLYEPIKTNRYCGLYNRGKHWLLYRKYLLLKLPASNIIYDSRV
jgi:hypothetical protein